MTPNLYDSFPRLLTHNRTSVSDISDLPNALGWLSQIPNILPRLGLEQPDPAVVPTSYEEVLVELERGHGRVVGGYPLEDGVGFEGEGDDAAVRTPCRQDSRRELDLAYEGSMPL